MSYVFRWSSSYEPDQKRDEEDEEDDDTSDDLNRYQDY
jgi:hypothetical protein